MATKNLDYWYDGQIRRYLIQLIRVFSHFQVKENTSSGESFNRVPVKYGDSSRMVSAILRNNSENIVNSAPQIALTIQNIQPAPDRIQDPYWVDKIQVAEREWDEAEGVYTSEQGSLYTVERYMPVPYNLTIQVDIWTTNTTQKLEILEQFFILFNPSLQLQVNDNPLDWANVFEVKMEAITWTNRGIPSGPDEQLDVATLNFEVPIWISPPAKVKRQEIIQRIVANLHNIDTIADLGYDPAYFDFLGDLLPDSSVIVTPNNYRIALSPTAAVLLSDTGTSQPWSDLLLMQGELTDSSRLEVNISSDPLATDEVVIGSVAAHPTLEETLVFTLDTDTLPGNTLTSVDKIIDPRATSPGAGLPAAVTGQRYLLTEPTSADTIGWGFVSEADDIIEYDGTSWAVSFDSSEVTTNQWVVNDTTSEQYVWTGTQWQSSWQGTYNAGFWKLIL